MNEQVSTSFALAAMAAAADVGRACNLNAPLRHTVNESAESDFSLTHGLRLWPAWPKNHDDDRSSGKAIFDFRSHHKQHLIPASCNLWRLCSARARPTNSRNLDGCFLSPKGDTTNGDGPLHCERA